LRILANENFSSEAVLALRYAGHNVAWVRTDAPGSSDQDVLDRAQAEERVIVTFDKDFGELAFLWGLPSSCGVILFRIQPRSSNYISRVAVNALGSRNDWSGNFSVIEDDRIRMTPLPSIKQ
jgi:predicted nuclease of predicted toxin-antitoxin system